MVKTLDNTYANSELNEVADNVSHLNYEEINLLLSLLEDFEDLFDGTLGKWTTEPVNLELNPDPKPFNSRYYPVPRIKEETLIKGITRLVEIGVLTPVQHIQYGTPVFVIPKFSSRNIFNHLFHVDNDKGESGIGYNMIIGRDLMVQLGLTTEFKR